MKVKVLYFASLREAMGAGEETLELPAGVATVGALRAFIAGRGGASAAVAAPRIRAALDQCFAAEEDTLHDGAEVAFFPPVTGG